MSDPVEEYYRRFGGQAQTSVTVPVPGAASKAKKNQKELENIEKQREKRSEKIIKTIIWIVFGSNFVFLVISFPEIYDSIEQQGIIDGIMDYNSKHNSDVMLRIGLTVFFAIGLIFCYKD